MLITPHPPTLSQGQFKHGSILNENLCLYRVTSQRQSTVNDQIELTFDGINLADSPGRRFADSELYPIEYETFGPRYLIGMRFKY